MSHPSPAPVPEAVVRELAPTGPVRAAINFGNPVLAQRGPGGEPRGITVELAREVAARAGRPLELVPFDAAGKSLDALVRGVADIAFLAIDPARADVISFTSPYVVIEGSYVVREASPLRRLEDFDRSGVRIAVGRGAAYDLFLTRALQHAELVRADTSAAALDLFLAQGLEAAAGVRQPLLAFAAQHPGLRVIDGSFTSIRQAMAVPKGRDASLGWLQQFIEAMKASGFVAAALARSGQKDAMVAPPGNGA